MLYTRKFRFYNDTVLLIFIHKLWVINFYLLIPLKLAIRIIFDRENQFLE